VTKVPKAAILAIMMIIASPLSGCSGLGGSAPNAEVNADQTEINVGETVNFDARESSTPNPTIIDEYQWNFGDGNEKTTKQGVASHTFLSSGYHDVRVTVLNDAGETDKASVTIFVNSAPTVVLEMPGYIRAGDTATLDASNSYDPEGASMEFIWDFNVMSDSNNDGDPSNDADSVAPIAELTIENSGNRSGSITVVDDKGATSTTYWSLMVTSRTFNVVWEEQILDYEWSGYLEQGQSFTIEHEPGTGARVMQVNATLTLARDLIPIMWPEDNFTLSIDMQSGWSSFSSTQQDNVTQNSTATIERGEMNSYPNSGYTVTSDSKSVLEEALLNEAGERFGQGTWEWTITADQCDPDLPVDDVDPDQGNDWQLTVRVVVFVLRLSEVSS
jgi:hypothetical protein